MREDERKKEGQVTVDVVFETSQARKLTFMREVRKKGGTGKCHLDYWTKLRPSIPWMSVATVAATALVFQQMRLLFEHQ